MGNGDADIGGGLERPSLTEVDRETLMALLKAANITIERLEAERDSQHAVIAPLDNPMLRATGYRVQTDEDSKEMRISFFHGAEKNIIAWMILPTPEVYGLAERCLQCYDKLEGIK